MGTFNSNYRIYLYFNRCHSLEKLQRITYRRAFTMVSLTWVYSLFWAVSPYPIVGAYVLEGYALNCSFQYLDQSIRNKVYVGFIYLGAFMIPVMVISVCYIKIYAKIRAHTKNLVNIARVNTSAVNYVCDAGYEGRTTSLYIRNHSIVRLQKTEYQIALIGMILTALYLVSWTPYATMALIGQYVDPGLIIPYPMAQLVPVLFAKCSAVWNPFVYAIKHTSFQKAIKVQYHKRSFFFQLPRLETHSDLRGSSRGSSAIQTNSSDRNTHSKRWRNDVDGVNNNVELAVPYTSPERCTVATLP